MGTWRFTLRYNGPGSVVGASVVITAAAWYDARQYAQGVLREDPSHPLKQGVTPQFDWCEASPAEATIRLTWHGTDAGLRPNRRLTVETKTG